MFSATTRTRTTRSGVERNNSEATAPPDPKRRSDRRTYSFEQLSAGAMLCSTKRVAFFLNFISLSKIIYNNAKHGQSADYLKPLIEMYQPSRTLRPASRSLHFLRKAKTENYGCKAFSFVAPKMWNSLLEDIKNSKTVICFKNKLKLIFLGKPFYFSKRVIVNLIS